MRLDPYLSQVVTSVTEARLLDSLRTLYPPPEWDDEETPWGEMDGDLEEVAAWRRTAIRKPGSALSTSRTKSFRGIVTCALLHALAVPNPKTVRIRSQMAWAILRSNEGMRVIGENAELDGAYERWASSWCSDAGPAAIRAESRVTKDA